mmetsp:Transcript_67613/g.218360  ORF Transcript_67613/g.218360 Transcript_67613/m.218360 type:complete len:128 (+) Transcript_67613:20-403(+)
MGRRFAALEFGREGRLLPGRAADELLAAGADTKAHSAAVKELVGGYACQVPGGGCARVVVAEAKGALLARSDRPDWPASVLHLRADLVFLQNSPGVWGRRDGPAVRFSNGITWVRRAAGPPGGRQDS